MGRRRRRRKREGSKRPNEMFRHEVKNYRHDEDRSKGQRVCRVGKKAEKLLGRKRNTRVRRVPF